MKILRAPHLSKDGARPSPTTAKGLVLRDDRGRRRRTLFFLLSDSWVPSLNSDSYTMILIGVPQLEHLVEVLDELVRVLALVSEANPAWDDGVDARCWRSSGSAVHDHDLLRVTPRLVAPPL